MNTIDLQRAAVPAILLAVCLGWQGRSLRGSEIGCLAPVAIAPCDGGECLAVLGSTGRRLVVLDAFGGDRLRTIDLPAEGGGIVVRDGTAYITTREPAGRVLVVDLDTGEIQRQYRVGHTPMAPTLGPDGRVLYVANRFDHTVGMIDLRSGVMRTVDVVREPVALVASHDGRRLFAANHLPRVRPFLDDENPFIGAEVSVLDTGEARLVANIELPNGSQSLRGMALSPDGRYVLVTHIASNYTRPALQVAGGAMNRNAVSILDAETLQWSGTAVLDDPQRGAANPWAIRFGQGGTRLLVTHAGTHELSVIDFPAMLQRVTGGGGASDLYGPDALHAMAGIRRRDRLPVRGARALLVQGDFAFVAGYFSDNLALLDWTAADRTAREIPLVDRVDASPARLGEQYFNDASECFQQWQSCATCHPDGRSDSLYWDLLNDGVGNTKNTKSLLMSALTPPAMWRGVRADSATAIRSGIRHIQFGEPRPEQAEAIEQYLATMPAVPGPSVRADLPETAKTQDASCVKCHSPGAPRGTLSAAAARGKAIFEGPGQCVLCHPHPVFTSKELIDPGLGSGVLYDVPSLIEVWRTAPYLHSGDALTLRETITDHNFLQKRGRTSDLTEQELSDLLEYLRSL